MACFEDDFEACIAHLRLPIGHRRVIRTTNLLERMFGEERRRTKVIPHAFGEKAVMKLMYAALMRARQGWRNVVVTSFEVKQIQTLRDHLNNEFEQRHASPLKSAIPLTNSQHEWDLTNETSREHASCESRPRNHRPSQGHWQHSRKSFFKGDAKDAAVPRLYDHLAEVPGATSSSCLGKITDV